MNAKLRRKKTEPRRPGRPRADEANQRERLLDAAVDCFAGDGIAATSLRTIALKAGVTPALVHYYFGSKEQLVDAFIAERVTPVAAALRESLLAAGPEPRALIAAFVRGIHDVVERHPWWPALWVREVLNEKGALRDVLRKQIAPQVAQLIAGALAEAQKRGELAPDLDPRLTMVSLMGLTMMPLAAEHIWRRVFAADDIDRDVLLRHTLALLDHGLGGRRAR
ncbi:MAG TPA: TetR/AcrR family transcriptional regulator [Gammaproteobacteria bacterium]